MGSWMTSMIIRFHSDHHIQPLVASQNQVTGFFPVMTSSLQEEERLLCPFAQATDFTPNILCTI